MKKKSVLLCMLLAAVLMAVTGCKGMTPDDAKVYVQSVLDASYKADFDEYTKQTDSTEEEAQKLYEDNLDNIMELGGFTDAGVSEELVASYRSLFQDMLSKAVYEVGEASEDGDDGFVVNVSAEPFTAFEGLQDEVLAAVQSEIDGITDVSQLPSEEQINEMVYQKMYDSLVQRVADPTYAEAQTVEIHVSPDKNNVYSISEDDLTELDAVLFPSDNL